MPGADVDDIYAAIRDLPVSERLKLVERVVHDLIDAETAPSQERDPRSVIGSLGHIADVMDQVVEGAMNARERDP